MKPSDTIDAKCRAKAILSLNIGDLNDKYGFKKPFMMFFDPILGNLNIWLIRKYFYRTAIEKNISATHNWDNSDCTNSSDCRNRHRHYGQERQWNHLRLRRRWLRPCQSRCKSPLGWRGRRYRLGPVVRLHHSLHSAASIQNAWRLCFLIWGGFMMPVFKRKQQYLF